MIHRTTVMIAIIAIAGFSRPAQAQDEGANRAEFTFDARARTESVEEDNPLLDATSFTVRARAGARSPVLNGFDAFLEVEAVQHLGSEDFNSGANGNTEYSAVLDHDIVEINQLAVRYRDANHYVQLGRQHMVLDNERFFGDVVYRQNQQTFDAFSYMNTALQGQQFRYVYMTRARRFLSDEHPVGEIDMNSHLLNYNLQRLNGDAFSAYAYFIDMDTPAVVQNSTKTFGLRYTGSYPLRVGDLLYTLEYANQSDFGDGAATNDADYVMAELGLKFNNEWVAKIGQERLGGDGVYGFQTPFGTNHLFNGYADIFAARTPANGLIDSFVSLTAPLWGARTQLAAHDFAADAGNADHGSELNVRIEKRFADRFAISLLFADYQADNFAVDTTKWAIWLDFRY